MILLFLAFTAIIGLILLGIAFMNDGEGAGFGIIVLAFFIAAILIGCPMITSYVTSVRLQADYQTIKLAHPQAIVMYQNKMVIDTNALTDFRYQGYQNNIADMIMKLRDKVDYYNRSVIKKKLFSKNIWFGTYINVVDLPLMELREQMPKK